MTPQRQNAPPEAVRRWCTQLGSAVSNLVSVPVKKAHQRRVDWAVVGATTGVLLLLGGGVYIRVRTGGRRPRSTVVWLLVFAVILVSVLVNSRLRVHPTERTLSNLYRPCSVTSSRHACAAICEKAKSELRLDTRSPISRMLYIATPLVFVFAAVAFFSIYTRSGGGLPTRRRRRRPTTGRNGNMSTSSFNHHQSTPIAVFSVALPTRPQRITPSFKLKSVKQDDDDEEAMAKTDPQCAICLADIWTKPVGELSCGHRFHVNCVSDWLRKAPRPTCPLCKAIVGDEDGPQEPVA